MLAQHPEGQLKRQLPDIRGNTSNSKPQTQTQTQRRDDDNSYVR